MSRGLSKQQTQILELLKKRGIETPQFPSMGTTDIVMALRPEVQTYLDEVNRYCRFVHRNMMNPHIPEAYLEHEKKLASLPNYHTARTSVNRALRNLVKRGLVARLEYRNMFQYEGTMAFWLLVEYADKYKVSAENLKWRQEIQKDVEKDMQQKRERRRKIEMKQPLFWDHKKQCWILHDYYDIVWISMKYRCPTCGKVVVKPEDVKLKITAKEELAIWGGVCEKCWLSGFGNYGDTEHIFRMGTDAIQVEQKDIMLKENYAEQVLSDY